MIQQKQSQALFIVGAIFTLAGALANLFNVLYAPYIFSGGAAVIIFLQLLQMLNAKDLNLRMRRLTRIGLFSSLLLALAAYLMFTRSNSWVLAVLIYALSTLFYTFRGDKK